MDGYLDLADVVTVGETGVTPSQHVSRWEPDEQRAVVEGQMALAAGHELPISLHTPNQSDESGRSYRSGMGTPAMRGIRG